MYTHSQTHAHTHTDTHTDTHSHTHTQLSLTPVQHRSTSHLNNRSLSPSLSPNLSCSAPPWPSETGASSNKRKQNALDVRLPRGRIRSNVTAYQYAATLSLRHTSSALCLRSLAFVPPSDAPDGRRSIPVPPFDPRFAGASAPFFPNPARPCDSRCSSIASPLQTVRECGCR